MKRQVYRLIVVALILCVAITFGLSSLTFAYSEKRPMVLKISSDTPPEEIESRTITRLGNLVQERTNGRIKAQYFYSGSLIKKPQFADGVAKGIANISIGPSAFLSGKIPDLSIFEVFGSYDLAKWKAVEKALSPLLTELMAKEGVRHVMCFYPGPALFVNKHKFLKGPGDWKGQKMRLPGRWQSTLGKQWGASPVFLPPSELYLALQRGVIVGFMLPWHLVHAVKLYEVAPYIAHTDFSNLVGLVTMTLKKWNAMTEEDQKIFNQVAEEVAEWSYPEIMKSQAHERDEIISKGGKVYDMTPAEKSSYLEKCYALWPEVRKASGPIGNKFADILEDYRDR
jgi:C4-dicarboxylate-binding protein DctP